VHMASRLHPVICFCAALFPRPRIRRYRPTNVAAAAPHAPSPVNASVDQERLCPLPTLVGAMFATRHVLGSRKFITFLRTTIAATAKDNFGGPPHS